MSGSMVTIVSIVEGAGEKRALPRLLHRLAREVSIFNLLTPEPWRLPRGKLTMAGGIENAVAAAALRVDTAGGVLVLLDADDDCPATLGPELLRRVRAERPAVPISVVLANREFEAWFIAAAESLAGTNGFPADLTAPADPEKIRGAKEWLGQHRTDGRPYKATVDQAPLASAFDLEAARIGSPSFDKFCRDTRALLASSYSPGSSA
jgi:hypothetical protein